MSTDTDSPSLYEQILGPAFERLPPLLRAIHDRRERKQYAGQCRVIRGQGWVARAIAAATLLPGAHENIPLTVAIRRSGSREIWTRKFGDQSLRSRICTRAGALEERLGLVTLSFDLLASGESIAWVLRRARLLFVPLPLAWFAGTTATESIEAGRYSFDVRAVLGGLGLLIHYRGWLIEHA